MSSQNPSDQVPDYGQYVPPTDQHGTPGGQPGQQGWAGQQAPYGPPAGQQGQHAPQGQYPPPGYQGHQGHQGGPAAPLSPADTKTWASLSHLLGGILGFLAPLVIWLVFRERSHVVDVEAKKALNFQIPVALVLLAASWVLPGFLSGLVVFGVWVASLVLGIIAFQAVSNGRPASYPIDVKIVK
ncbi:DUF4870 domain-containing protein [Oerskovia turbata]|uniref:DUF4870 domain-containing protein n=1 Tax=Oerskovia turbata TaxID=1713 RepID=A0A4Q1L2W2_9CELL|nr:DUF4870 domain-containing protein [Oerskovia turbata]RXR26152.1 DUF4870 domain-containing protein [Oerskovia turbata]RXR36654.1 DUF4870 domain-containing protein [Oerskovia turbata]TGJ94618.1 DUF4870 domain-containing protein [Actinotalea fermentans ATCC 43279 = JCM 9966 = DSM 3133]